MPTLAEVFLCLLRLVASPVARCSAWVGVPAASACAAKKEAFPHREETPQHYDMNDSKASWDKIQKRAGQLLMRAVPDGTPGAAQGRKSFMQALAADKGRMKRVKDHMDHQQKGDQRATQALLDWYTHFQSDPTSFQKQVTGGTAKASSATSTSPTRTSASPSSSTLPSSTSTPWSTVHRGRNKVNPRGVETTEEEERSRCSDLTSADDSPLLMPDNETEAPRLRVTDTIEKAIGYYFCNIKEGATIARKFANSPNPIAIIMPSCSRQDFLGLEAVLEKMKEQNGTIFPSVTKTSMLVLDSNLNKVKGVSVIIMQIDEFNPIRPASAITDHQ